MYVFPIHYADYRMYHLSPVSTDTLVLVNTGDVFSGRGLAGGRKRRLGVK